MTWKRIATAAVLIPVVVGVVWFGSVGLVALLSAGIATLAIIEFFALAEHVGMRAYKLWTLVSALADIGASATAILFIALPLSAVVRLRAVNEVGPQLLLFTLVLVWV